MLKRITRRVTIAYNSVESRVQYEFGAFKGEQVVYTYWFNRRVNFGDLLTPALLDYYGISPVHTSANKAGLVMVGSVLQGLPETFSGRILGSGLLQDTKRRFPNAKIMALRGELTRDRIGAYPSTPLGDPGVVADVLLPQRHYKNYVLGLVPHFKDKGDERIKNLRRRYGDKVLAIDVQRNPIDVIEDIDKCEHIISSSLHGIIVADSLGIPNAWAALSKAVVGDGFKFYDYGSAFGKDYKPIGLNGFETLSMLVNETHKVNDNINEVKDRIKTVLSNLSSVLRRSESDTNGR